MVGHIFISHAHEDQALAHELRTLLEASGTPTWLDVRRIAGGDALTPAILDGIRSARHVLALISPHALNSTWVQNEIREGLRVAASQPGFKVIPLLLPPTAIGALRLLFPEQTAALNFDPTNERLDDLIPKLHVAFGDALPDVPASFEQPMSAPLAELVLRLERPEIDESGGERRATATARLVYEPPQGSMQRRVESTSFLFRGPLGPIEAGELAWYLERFAIWPSKQFESRAEQVETSLERWGRLLFDAIDLEAGRNVWQAFERTGAEISRCISIEVEPDPPAGTDKAEAERIQQAATLLLGLPWELLRDDRGLLVGGKRGVRVRRRLPNRHVTEPLVTPTPIRVLVVSPRPEDDRAGYIDHRVSAGPLVEALAQLGQRVELELLDTPTLAGLSTAVATRGPFHVLHFDGHGVYSRERGLGMLCFEDPTDAEKLERRRTMLISADELGEVMREHRIPLVFLEACQSAKTDEDPSASVAGRLLQAGVASVIAMSHSVLVETAKRFVEVFYRELSSGASVGAAMHSAQRGLREDAGRGRGFHGDLQLRDWFVPVLYQEQIDPQLVRELPSAAGKEGILARARKAVESLPSSPTHGFVGRSRELLKIERLLARERYAVLVGEGGEGKTAIAVEQGRWLVASRRFDKAAIVSVEDGSARDVRAVLSKLGGQLVTGFDREAGGEFERGWQHLERALRDRATLLIFDNMESILPGEPGFEPEVLDAILDLARRCTEVGGTRILFTSRTRLPEPFGGNVVRIGRLERWEAVEIVGKVLAATGGAPADDGVNGEGVELLVETAQCHARSLVLLAEEVRRVGVRRTTQELHELMVGMEERYPEDRERSLFASVELSLRRLPAGVREKIRGLGVFQGGGHGAVIAQVLGLDYAKDEEVVLGQQLIEVGLAEDMGLGHLRLHPALAPLLLREMSEDERTQARGMWMEAMVGLVGFLNEQQFKSAQVSAVLTLLELPNLLALLDVLHSSDDVARIVDVTTSLEGLIHNLGRPRALARVVAAREEASRRLDGWSHAQFISTEATIDRLLDAGRFAEAVKAAQAQMELAKAAGESAYPEASYDLAMACWRLGRALKNAGAAAHALGPLREALLRFNALAEGGTAEASRMVSVCLADTGHCFTDLGRLDEAANAYETAIEQADASGAQRDVAVGKGQLGTVRMHQRRYDAALEAYRGARDTFEQLGEPGSVAIAWHQIGITHRRANQLDAAEQAYRQALALEVQQGNRSGEANTLGELGNLYDAMGRLEDAVRFHQDAATIDVESGDTKGEGTSRGNLANTLVKLGRHDEARQELLRAIACKHPFGHAAEPWKTFGILSDLERAVGNLDAAALARQWALDAYLAYRRDGGENHTHGGRLAHAVHQAITTNTIDQLAPQLEQLAAHPDLPDYLCAMIPALQAILAGSRDPSLASDSRLDYTDAAELLLLLEFLP